MEKNLERNKGITLIALVITIIVLLIFIGVAIATLTGDNGILTKANSAKILTNEGEEKETVSLAYNGSIAETKGDTVSATDMQKQLDDNKIDASAEEVEGKIKVTFNKTGNVYIINANGIIEKRKSLEDYGVKFGDFVNYDEGTGYTYTTNPEEGASNQWPAWSSDNYASTGNGYVFSSGDFTTEDLNWRVLGVSDTGNLELISEYPTSEQLYIGCKSGYINCEKILNEFCDTLYGKGAFADSARSLTNEDIYKLRGITKMDSTLYNGYGKQYQFRYEDFDTGLMYRTSTEPEKNWTEWTNANIDSFYTIENGLELGKNKRGISEVITCDFVIPYFYNGNDFITKIIYCEGINNSNSWLASKGIRDEGNRISYAISCTHSNATLYSSNNSNGCMNEWVRPVVTLQSDIKIDTTTTNGESAEKAYEIK